MTKSPLALAELLTPAGCAETLVGIITTHLTWPGAFATVGAMACLAYVLGKVFQ